MIKKLSSEEFEIIEFEVLENRCRAENNPLNLIKGYQGPQDLINLFKKIGPEDFCFWVNLILDENE